MPLNLRLECNKNLKNAGDKYKLTNFQTNIEEPEQSQSDTDNETDSSEEDFNIKVANTYKTPKFMRDTANHPLKFKMPSKKEENKFQSQDQTEEEIIKQMIMDYDCGPRGGEKEWKTTMGEDQLNLLRSEAKSDLPHVKIKLKVDQYGKKMETEKLFALLDSGSTSSFIRKKVFNRLFPDQKGMKITYTHNIIKTAMGSQNVQVGKISLNVQFTENLTIPICFKITDLEGPEIIIGSNFLMNKNFVETFTPMTISIMNHGKKEKVQLFNKNGEEFYYQEDETEVENEENFILSATRTSVIQPGHSIGVTGTAEFLKEGEQYFIEDKDKCQELTIENWYNNVYVENSLSDVGQQKNRPVVQFKISNYTKCPQVIKRHEKIARALKCQSDNVIKKVSSAECHEQKIDNQEEEECQKDIEEMNFVETYQTCLGSGTNRTQEVFNININQNGRNEKIIIGNSEQKKLSSVDGMDLEETFKDYSEIPGFKSYEPLQEKIRLEHLTPEQQEQMMNLMLDNSHVFAKNNFDIGKTTLYKHKIKTKEGYVSQQKRRHLTPNKEKFLDAYMEPFVDKGIVEDTQSPFSSNLVLVARPNYVNPTGSKFDQKMEKINKNVDCFRVTQDLRTLNSLIEPDVVTLEPLETVAAKIKGKIFSSLDICQGFWHIEIAKEDRHKTAFFYKNGKKAWTRLIPGLSDAPSAFINLMKKILSDETRQWISDNKGIPLKDIPKFESFAHSQMDDVIIFSSNFEEHKKHLQLFFFALERAGLKINPAKAKFYVTSGTFLGMHIDTSKNEIGINESRLQGMLDWKKPSSLAEVFSRLASLNYVSQHLPRCKEILAPLYNLIRNKKFKWTEEEDKAWKEINVLLKYNVKLKIPDEAKPFHLFVDSSKLALASCLVQLIDGEFEIINTVSKLLSAKDSEAPIHAKEAMALLSGFQNNERYLLFAQKIITVYSDARALSFIYRYRQHSSKYDWTSSYLSRFARKPGFEVRHIGGKANFLADILSRRYHQMFNDREAKFTLSKQQALIFPSARLVGKMTPEQVWKLLTTDPPPEAGDTGKIKRKLRLPPMKLITLNKLYEKLPEKELIKNTEKILEGNKINLLMEEEYHIEVQKTIKDIKLPQRATKDAGGIDVFMPSTVVLQPGEQKLIDMGFKIKVPQSTCVKIYPRSSFVRKNFNIHIHEGVIDSDFRGSVKLLVVNKSPQQVTFNKDNRIVQLVVHKILTNDPVEVTSMDETKRGLEGFGSTGQEEVKYIHLSSFGNAYLNLNTKDRRLKEEAMQAYTEDDNHDITNYILNETRLDGKGLTMPNLYVEDTDLPYSERYYDNSPIFSKFNSDEAVNKMRYLQLIDNHLVRDEFEPDEVNTVYSEEDGQLVTTLFKACSNKLTSAHIKKLQETDPMIRNIRENINKRKGFKIVNDILFKTSLDRVLKKTKYHLVIPDKLTSALAMSAHIDLGHAGGSTAYKYLKNMYFNNKMHDACMQATRQCVACNLNNVQTIYRQNLGTERTLEPEYPRQCVSTDLAINLPETSKGYKHVLLVVDLFSGLLATGALKTKTSQEVLECFNNIWLQQMGLPEAVYSDSGMEFLGNFGNFMLQNGVAVHSSMPHTPSQNGSSEIMVRNLKLRLGRSLTQQKLYREEKEWTELLPLITMQLNNSPSVHSFSRYMIHYAMDHEKNASLDILPEEDGEEDNEEKEKSDEEHSPAETIWEKVRNEKIKNRMQRARMVKRKRVGKIKKNQLVLLKRQEVNIRALDNKMAGPYRVESVLAKGAQLRDVDTGATLSAPLHHIYPIQMEPDKLRFPQNWAAEIAMLSNNKSLKNIKNQMDNIKKVERPRKIKPTPQYLIPKMKPFTKDNWTIQKKKEKLKKAQKEKKPVAVKKSGTTLRAKKASPSPSPSTSTSATPSASPSPSGSRPRIVPGAAPRTSPGSTPRTAPAAAKEAPTTSGGPDHLEPQVGQPEDPGVAEVEQQQAAEGDSGTSIASRLKQRKRAK